MGNENSSEEKSLKGRVYALRRHPWQAGKGRVVPPRRTANLKAGGGRKDLPGWTEQKRKANRRRFDALRPVLKTGVTICYPSYAKPQNLAALNQCSRNFCKEHKLPARCVWEGPGFHQHVALGIAFDGALDIRWRSRLQRRWLQVFRQPMGTEAFMWKPEEEPDKIASYLSKTRKDGSLVKGAFDWLTFCPVWETGFRRVMHRAAADCDGDASPLKKSVSHPLSLSPEKERHVLSPRNTVFSPEKMGERTHPLCQACWTRWGRSLWAGSCGCTGHVVLKYTSLR